MDLLRQCNMLPYFFFCIPQLYLWGSPFFFFFVPQLYLWGSPIFFFFVPQGFTILLFLRSPAISLGFTILLFLRSPAISLGFTFLGEIFAYVTVFFFNPTIEVVTCHTETEVADEICYLTQPQYTDNRLTGTDSLEPGV